MKHFDILLLGNTWRVSALCALDPPPSTVPERTVVILPRPYPDVTALAPTAEMREPWRVLLLLGFYYSKLCGYPRSTLDVDLSGKRYELEIFDTPPHYIGIRLPKCKQLSTIIYTTPDLNEHRLHTVLSDGLCRVLELGNSHSFHPSVLSDVQTLRGEPIAREAVALIGNNVVPAPDCAIRPSLLVAAAVCHSDFIRGELSFTSGGVDYTAVDRGDSLLLLTKATLSRVSEG